MSLEHDVNRHHVRLLRLNLWLETAAGYTSEPLTSSAAAMLRAASSVTCEHGLVATDLPPADALVIVDLQRGFVEGRKAIPDASRVVDRIECLLNRARQAGAVVVHLQNDGAPGAVDEPGTAGWRLWLSPIESIGEVVFRKSADDGFMDTGLAELLDGRGVRRVVIGGLLSEMCLSATARGALARGFKVVIPRDSHGTYDLDDIPARVVSRVAEHALGDEPVFVDAADVTFVAPRG
jgi:nicotinamidase-related amidase